MSRGGKRASMRDYQQRVMGGARCPDCGKVRFLSKADAKHAAKRVQHRDGRLNTYACGEFWHLGRLPAAVTKGLATRDDLNRRTA